MSSGCRAFFGGAAGIRTSGFPGQGLVGQSRRKLCLFGNHDAAGWREAFSFPAQYELCHFRRSSCLASFAVSRTRLNISIARIAPFDRQNSRMGSTSSLFPKNTTGGQTNPPSRLQTCLIQSQMLNLTALGTHHNFRPISQALTYPLRIPSHCLCSRLTDTGTGVLSSCAKRLTRSSSSSQRNGSICGSSMPALASWMARRS